MLEITRNLARLLRAVCRRSVGLGSDRRSPPPILCRSDGRQLIIQCVANDMGVAYTHPDARADEGKADTVVLPTRALADCEGRDESPVLLERVAANQVRVRWHDRGILVTDTYDAVLPDSLPAFPPAPDHCSPLPPTFLTAFADAAQTAHPDGTRLGLSRVQLRGKKGIIAASDGRQLLLQEGFPFPWPEDLLVTRVDVFGLKEVAAQTAVSVGRTATHVFLRAGPWTLALPLDTQSRFPDVESVIPRATGRGTRWRVAAEEVELLRRALPRLPGTDGDHAPITLDLGSPVAVRARADGDEHATELVLPASLCKGPPQRLCLNRQFLARALALGFTEFLVARPGAPMLATDGQRRYVWMVLDAKAALAPSPEDRRLDPAAAFIGGSRLRRLLREATEPCAEEPPPPTPPLPDPLPRIPIMVNKPPTNGAMPPPRNGAAEPAPADNGADPLLAEAQVLHTLLREALSRLQQLTAAIKQERRQRRQVQATLAALRQLQPLRP